MQFKFEKLDVWKLSLNHIDLAYRISKQLPASEKYNLSDQLKRSSVSVSLNIAEGSTGQSDAEQKRFLSISLRSLIETVAVIRIINHLGYQIDKQLEDDLGTSAHLMFRKLQAFKKALR